MFNRHLIFATGASLFLMAGCAGGDNESPAERCRGLGYETGTAAFERCMKEEEMRRTLKEQREQEKHQQLREQQEKAVPKL